MEIGWIWKPLMILWSYDNGNYLSQKDIEHLLTFDITQLSAEPNYSEMKALFDAFKAVYMVT